MAKDRQVGFFERMVQKAMGKNGQVGLDNDPAATQWPHLWEWLSTVYIGEERIKQPPSITVQLAPGGVVVRINDRDLAAALEITCPNLGDCFAALEATMASGAAITKQLGRKEPHIRKRKKE